MKNGTTYLSVMEQNLEVLKDALNKEESQLSQLVCENLSVDMMQNILHGLGFSVDAGDYLCIVRKMVLVSTLMKTILDYRHYLR